METSGPLNIPPGHVVIFAVETAEDAIVFEVALDPPGAQIRDVCDRASVVAVELAGQFGQVIDDPVRLKVTGGLINYIRQAV